MATNTQSAASVSSSECVIPPDMRKSMWFQKGQEEGKKRTPLKKTIVFNLRFGCRHQDEFLAGYDNPNA